MTFAAGIGGTGERAYVGGTLSANPLSCVAGYYALLEMERTNAPVIAGQAGDRLTRGLQAIIDKYDLPFVAFNQGSIVHLETSGVMLLDLRNPIRLAKELKPRKHMMEEMGAAYMANGLVTLAGWRMYTSMADTDEVIDDALERFDSVLQRVPMTIEKLILAVDLGTSGMKVALVTIDGQVLGWEVEPLSLILTPDGGVEQTPEEWWQAFITASNRLLRRGLMPGSPFWRYAVPPRGKARCRSTGMEKL